MFPVSASNVVANLVLTAKVGAVGPPFLARIGARVARDRTIRDR